jgi:hypothetical protein
MVHQQRDRHSDYWADDRLGDYLYTSRGIDTVTTGRTIDSETNGTPQLVSESIVLLVVTVSIPLQVYH